MRVFLDEVGFEMVYFTPNGHPMGSISPNFYVAPIDFPNKILLLKFSDDDNYSIDKILDDELDAHILVYEDRTYGWFLDFARILTKEKNSEFVVLMISISYLEGNQQYREGCLSEGNSTRMLQDSMQRIFPDVAKKNIKIFVDLVRQGLFHDGMTRRGILLGYGKGLPFIDFTPSGGEDWLLVDPALFLNDIEKDFKLYIEKLKNKENILDRENFEKVWKKLYYLN